LKILLFDIDGTIIRSKRAGYSRIVYTNIVNKVFGSSLDTNLLPDFSGMTDKEIFNQVCFLLNIKPENHSVEMNKIWDLMHEDMQNNLNNSHELILGIDKILEKLQHNKNLHCSLLTGNIQKTAFTKLNSFGVGKYFSSGAFGDDSHNRNELPRFAFDRIKSEYNLDFQKEKSIIIGDSPKDIECAKTNGLKVIAMGTGSFSSIELKKFDPDYVLDDYTNQQNFLDIIELI